MEKLLLDNINGLAFDASADSPFWKIGRSDDPLSAQYTLRCIKTD